MSVLTRTVDASIPDVWRVLADGWLYPLWVVGATRMRSVDRDWPAVGSELHHSVGVWPCVVNDTTRVLEVETEHRLVLLARAWPTGEAEVGLTLTAAGSRTRIEMREDAVSGPGRLVPPLLRSPLIGWRNSEALGRLAALAQGR